MSTVITIYKLRLFVIWDLFSKYEYTFIKIIIELVNLPYVKSFYNSL